MSSLNFSSTTYVLLIANENLWLTILIVLSSTQSLIGCVYEYYPRLSNNLTAYYDVNIYNQHTIVPVHDADWQRQTWYWLLMRWISYREKMSIAFILAVILTFFTCPSVCALPICIEATLNGNIQCGGDATDVAWVDRNDLWRTKHTFHTIA